MRQISKLLLGLLLLASSAQAQLPDWYPDPINQVKQLTKEKENLTKQVKNLKADVFSCDSLLGLTRQDIDIVIREKNSRIEELTKTGNTKLTDEYNRRVITATALGTLMDGLDDLEKQETDEALMSRFMGSGRKRAAKARREYIIRLKALVKQQAKQSE